MKRSSQVLLVLMGVTSATAIGHYLAPPQPTECVQQPQQVRPDNPQQALPPCKNTSSTRTGSHSGSSSSSNNSSSSSEHGKVASSTSTSGAEAGATRGGFGSTGHGIFSGS